MSVSLPAQTNRAHLHATCGGCQDGVAEPFPFSMAYQPIVDITARQIFAYEALVRGPEGQGAASILDKITLENRYAFDQSCRRRAIEVACRAGLVDTGAKLSINFIPGAVYQPEACIRVTINAARRAALPFNRLIFEVTEGEPVRDRAHLDGIFREYRRQGFATAIDDFGAGYAGLNLLADFQPEIIKIDMDMIRRIDSNRVRQVLVNAIVNVCKDLNIQVIAEGVETEAELSTLRDIGISLFQGYYLARPAFEALPVVEGL
jgi:EAL domain-containing protein (putative c-di-GMP-specific phosphodiesterase class I)